MNAGVGDKYTTELIKLFEKEGEQASFPGSCNLVDKNTLYLVVDRVRLRISVLLLLGNSWYTGHHRNLYNKQSVLYNVFILHVWISMCIKLGTACDGFLA